MSICAWSGADRAKTDQTFINQWARWGKRRTYRKRGEHEKA